MDLSVTRSVSRTLAAALIAAAFQLNAQTLPPNEALTLWLKADEGVTTGDSGEVLSWADQSGNLTDAFGATDGTAPILVEDGQNGQPTIRFDGVDDFLDVASTSTLLNYGDLTSFFVVKFDDFATFRTVWAKTDLATPSPTDYYLLPGSGIPRLLRGDGELTWVTVDGTRAPVAGSFSVMGFQHDVDDLDPTQGVITHFIDGDVNGSGEADVFVNDESWPLKIGTRDNFETRLKGELAELLIYNAVLSEEERNQVMAYLQAKYGLENEPPVVTVTSPEHNSSLEAPSLVTFTAEASDPDGSVSTVRFFINGNPVGTATRPPYSFQATVETPGSITVTAVASDDRGRSTTSSEVVLNMTAPAEPPTFEATENLKLWLKGDTGVVTDSSDLVTEWQDQSGNDHHALQVDPNHSPTVGELNGQPAIRFDGAEDFPDFLEVAHTEELAITGDIASFFVVRFDDFANYREIWGQTANNVPRPNDYYMGVNSGIPTFYRGMGVDVGVNAVVTGAGGVPADAPLLAGFQQAGTTVTHYLNGAPFGSGQITLTPESSGDQLRVGSRGDLFTKMKGEIAELLIFDAALSDEERVNLRRYLATKYGIPVILVENAAPTVTISAPSAGSEYPVPSEVTLTAEAEDSDGSIASVVFLANGQVIGTVTESPFSLPFAIDTEGQYEIVARTTDNFGRTATSAPITISAGEFAQLPIPAANLQLWLRADEGITIGMDNFVTLWEDRSGNDNHAAQSDVFLAPTFVEDAINGQPALRFDGADDLMTVTHSDSLVMVGDISSFFVVKFDDFATFRAVWAKTENNQPRPSDYYLLPTSGTPRVFRGGSAANGFVDALAAPAMGEFVILGFRQSGTDVTHYLNGEENGMGTIDLVEEDLGTDLIIGSRADGATRMFGDIAELVIYNRALNQQERTQIFEYLGEKYGLISGPVEGPEIAVSSGENTVTIAWPAAAGTFELQATDALGGSWNPVTEPVVPNGDQNTITVSTEGDARFFRLVAAE